MDKWIAALVTSILTLMFDAFFEHQRGVVKLYPEKWECTIQIQTSEGSNEFECLNYTKKDTRHDNR